ncbi:hypothetical protein RB597_001389 [Gaeumannomyces tritici]
MPARINKTEYGHSCPPEGPHTVTIHAKGWDSAMGIRDGDPAVFSRLVSMYPRFAPWGLCRQLTAAISKKLGLSETQTCIALTAADALELARAFACSPLRLEHQVKDPADLSLRTVDIGPDGGDRIRLRVVVGPAAAAKALGVAWQTGGLGVSSRLAEALLPHVETSLVEVDGDAAAAPGSWSGLREDGAHAALRGRIAELLRRAPLEPARAETVVPEDVFLYPTGMAAIYRCHQALARHRPGRVLVLGSVFKNTWHLFDESAAGMKHFGHCHDGPGLLADLEVWLAAEAAEGRGVSYCFLEFPSNPILVSADLVKLRALADRYGFPLVVDDTVGSFANIDMLPVADVVMSSLTKSFSGYADVMGGSIVLNKSIPAHYTDISRVFADQFVNELFAADAAQLVANSADYLARTAVLNRNAAALAALFDGRRKKQQQQQEGGGGGSSSSNVVITGVNYPPYTSTAASYAAAMRPDTPELRAGHGCLLSVDFETVGMATAFYDSLEYFHGPHLGAHRTLAIPFAALAFGKKGQVETAEYHNAYGNRAAQVRISAGLEDEDEVVGMAEEALARAEEMLGRESEELSN